MRTLSLLGSRFCSVLIALVTISSSAAEACPICDTATGQQVRAAIFGGDFLPTLFAILLPFPVLLALIALVIFAITPRPRPETGPEASHHTSQS